MGLTENHKFSLDVETSEKLRRRANLAGCGVSELIRDMVCLLEHNCTWGEYVAKHRRAQLRHVSQVQPESRSE